MTGYDVRLESASDTQAVSGLVLERSVRLEVVAANPGAAERADELAAALAGAMQSLTRDARMEPDPDVMPRVGPVNRVLVWVGDAGDPDPPPFYDGAVVVLDRATDNYDRLPQRLRHVHAVFWTTAEGTAYEVLGAAGVGPSSLRLFVSYSHADGVALAHRLFALLESRRFEVFLDVSSLEPGSDFEERIEHQLVDKAFLLLVETDAAVGSRWVRREVNFARRHRYGLAAIHPNTAGAGYVSGIGAGRRLAVDDSADLLDCDGHPTAAGLAVLDFVRRLHDQALVRRRAAIENSARAALDRAGHVHAVQRPGGLRVTVGVTRYDLALQPRPAALQDFERLDRGSDADRKILVSPRTRGRPERAALEWLSSRSDVWHASETRLRTLINRMEMEARHE